MAGGSASADELFEEALRAIAGAVERLVRVQAQRMAAEEIERRGLVPRVADGQPSAAALLGALHEAFERAIAGRNPGTYVGGWKVVKDVSEGLGVTGAGGLPNLRRTRAEVAAAPNPGRRLEGASGAWGRQLEEG